MDSLFGLMTILIPVVTALTGLAKKYVGEKYHALIPFVIGMVVAPLAFPLDFVTASIPDLIWAGGLSGLSAGGFYSVQNIRNK
ncbi:MAG: hypothetical protein ABS939_15720 [Psychrobacillus sp.]